MQKDVTFRIRKKSNKSQPTLEQYNLAIKLRKEGKMYKDISQIVGFNPDTIRYWASKKGRPQSIWTKEDWDRRASKINTKERNEKVRIAKLGSKNPNWKGDKVGWSGAHVRARSLYRCPLLKWMKLERHHIDKNPKNNDPSNIKFLTRRQHMMEDGRLEKLLIMIRNGDLKRGGKKSVRKNN